MEASLVAILGDGDRVVGAGVILEDRSILTCAHVVNMALGRHESNATLPQRTTTIEVFFHAAPGTGKGRARISDKLNAWSPPRADRAPGADFCLLELNQELPEGVAPAVARRASDLSGRRFRALGYPADWNESCGHPELDVAQGTVVGTEASATPMARVDVIRPAVPNARLKWTRSDGASAGAIRPGFSGGPVEIGGSVVAIVTEARPVDTGTAYLLPLSALPDGLIPSLGPIEPPLSDEWPHIGALRAYLERDRAIVLGDTCFDARFRLCESFAEVLEVHRLSKVAGAHHREQRESQYVPGQDLTASEFVRLVARKRDKQGRRLTNIVVSAPGGAGKTTLIRHLLLEAPHHGLVPFFLDLASPKRSELKLGQGSAEERLISLFSMFEAKGAVDELIAFRQADKSRSPLLAIDGLNQSTVSVDAILDCLSELSSGKLANAVIVVMDRLVVRSLNSSFNLAVVPPLAESAWREAIGNLEVDSGRWGSILSSPLFLELFLQIQRNGSNVPDVPTRYRLLERYFEARGLDDKMRQLLSLAAFELYKSGSTAFGQKALEKALHQASASLGIGDELVDQILTLLNRHDIVHQLNTHRTEGSQSEFRHQILHDHLAGRRILLLREDEETRFLVGAMFDTLSLNGASADAIELAVEALADRKCPSTSSACSLDVQRFLTSVYDWNYWVTLQSVMSFDRRGDLAAIPEPMRHAIYALNVEKRFDIFVHSVDRIERLLSSISSSTGHEYVNSKDAGVLRKAIQLQLDRFNSHVRQSGVLPLADRLLAVGTKTSNDSKLEAYWAEWRDLFSKTEPVTVAECDLLTRDAIVGWTAANVIGRLRPDCAVAARLVEMYRTSKSTSGDPGAAANYRWRIVHALRRAPAVQAAELLLSVLLDRTENRHVRYGATRSLVEIAVMVADVSDRKAIFDALRSKLNELFYLKAGDEVIGTDRRREAIVLTANIRQELRRCCALCEPNIADWDDRREHWWSTGLSEYVGLLESGAEMAREARPEEADRWIVWRDAAKAVSECTGSPWSERHQLWKKAALNDS